MTRAPLAFLAARLRIACLSALLLPAGPAAAAEAVSGPASVLDGDRIEIAGTVIHLAGVDAPERAQTCMDAAGKRYLCGLAAEIALAERVVGRTVTCEPARADRSFPASALCRADGEDLGAWLVVEGLAVVDRLDLSAYGPQEAAARQAGRGLWAGPFTMPWDLRRGVRGRPDGYATGIGLPAAVDPPRAEPARASSSAGREPGCAIKGNITAEGSRLYWVPGSRRYRETVITEGSGERWFCSEDEAKAAGWQEPVQPFGPSPAAGR